MWSNHCTTTFSHAVFGLPAISHKEFVNKLVEDVVSTWPGHVQLISGHLCHPQPQGFVEQTHYTLERMTSAKVVDVETNPTMVSMASIYCV